MTRLFAVAVVASKRVFAGSVRDNLRLANGQVWPIPITLDLPEEVAADLQRADELVLRDPEGLPLAILDR